MCTNTFTINGYGEHWQYTITNDYGTELGHGSDSGLYIQCIYKYNIHIHGKKELNSFSF